ncbi:GDP-mannose 4,6-dehydratase [Paenibacillus elgii]|uniref:GDP-mannose 4,6-dehydratase n=1 Tax=Paenibacillus elgii TaxID=189691 RepID=UPI0027B8D509|nr:GDP-mannose 4,6-dehydratase [Paenibacillus elgii]
MRNLADLEEGPNYRFVCGDIVDANFVAKVMAEAQIDPVVHFAAESHVECSISDPKLRQNKCFWNVSAAGSGTALCDRLG